MHKLSLFGELIRSCKENVHEKALAGQLSLLRELYPSQERLNNANFKRLLTP